MNSLQQDHELAEKSHRKVDDLGSIAVGKWPIVIARRRTSGNRAQAGCRAILPPHQDGRYGPCAANVLPSSDRVAMGAEMATRRGRHTP
jgi:hypothetical protein